MRILVTGGAGFIGSNIVEYHLQKGDTVETIDNLSTGSIENIKPFAKNPKFNFIQENILTWDGLEKAVAQADRIYHMAAVLGVFKVIEEPLNMLSVNINGTERLLAAIVKAKATPRIILASSSSVYGNSKKPLLNETDSLIVSPNTHPLWKYAVSKIADEAIAYAYYDMYKLPMTLVRLFNTIGPRQTGLYGMVVPRFVKQAAKGEPITVYGDGKQTRSFCDVRDSVVALDLVAEKNICICEPINVGRDVEISINELAEVVKERSGSQSPIKHIPYKEAYGIDFHDIEQRRPDISKLRELTGFKHRYTLEDTIDDLQKIAIL